MDFKNKSFPKKTVSENSLRQQLISTIVGISLTYKLDIRLKIKTSVLLSSFHHTRSKEVLI